MEKAIRKAVEGGYVITDNPEFVFGEWNMCRGHIFLNPPFWQALGKACGWSIKACVPFLEHRLSATGHGGNVDDNILWVDEEWQMHWHRFIDHLAEGKDAESFFNELLK